MTWQEMFNRFKLKVWNRNLQESDFISLMDEWYNWLTFMWRNFHTFREKLLSKFKEVPVYEEDNNYYILLSDIWDWVLEIEWEKQRQWDKVFINTDLVKVDDKAHIYYIKKLDSITDLTKELWLWSYDEALLDYVISTYYEMRTDSIQLANYYKNKVLTQLQL